MAASVLADRIGAVPVVRRRTGSALTYSLAGIGAALLAWEVPAVVGWLADGPEAVRGFSDPDSASWTAARVYEVLMVTLSLVVLVFVVRGCRRERTFTFDAKFLLAGGAMYALDPISNFYQPIFFYTSNWVNLGNWCNNMPAAVNPGCALMPEPVLFLGLLYSFGIVAAAVLFNQAMHWARRRWPGISNARLFGLTFLAGVVLDVLLEGPIVALDLWAYPGFPDSWLGTSVLGPDHKFPLIEVLVAALAFSGFAAFRFFKDDRGRTLVDRGLDGHRTGARHALSFLALVGAMHGLLFLTNVALWVHGPYASPYRERPAHLVNGLCDAPGVVGTAYGPCPGSPEYRIPIRRYPNASPNTSE